MPLTGPARCSYTFKGVHISSTCYIRNLSSDNVLVCCHFVLIWSCVYKEVILIPRAHNKREKRELKWCIASSECMQKTHTWNVISDVWSLYCLSNDLWIVCENWHSCKGHHCIWKSQMYLSSCYGSNSLSAFDDELHAPCTSIDNVCTVGSTVTVSCACKITLNRLTPQLITCTPLAVMFLSSHIQHTVCSILSSPSYISASLQWVCVRVGWGQLALSIMQCFFTVVYCGAERLVPNAQTPFW